MGFKFRLMRFTIHLANANLIASKSRASSEFSWKARKSLQMIVGTMAEADEAEEEEGTTTEAEVDIGGVALVEDDEVVAGQSAAVVMADADEEDRSGSGGMLGVLRDDSGGEVPTPSSSLKIFQNKKKIISYSYLDGVLDVPAKHFLLHLWIHRFKLSHHRSGDRGGGWISGGSWGQFSSGGRRSDAAAGDA